VVALRIREDERIADVLPLDGGVIGAGCEGTDLLVHYERGDRADDCREEDIVGRLGRLDRPEELEVLQEHHDGRTIDVDGREHLLGDLRGEHDLVRGTDRGRRRAHLELDRDGVRSCRRAAGPHREGGERSRRPEEEPSAPQRPWGRRPTRVALHGPSSPRRAEAIRKRRRLAGAGGPSEEYRVTGTGPSAPRAGRGVPPGAGGPALRPSPRRGWGRARAPGACARRSRAPSASGRGPPGAPRGRPGS